VSVSQEDLMREMSTCVCVTVASVSESGGPGA